MPYCLALMVGGAVLYLSLCGVGAYVVGVRRKLVTYVDTRYLVTPLSSSGADLHVYGRGPSHIAYIDRGNGNVTLLV